MLRLPKKGRFSEKRERDLVLVKEWRAVISINELIAMVVAVSKGITQK
jgi:hypothetical protein